MIERLAVGLVLARASQHLLAMRVDRLRRRLANARGFKSTPLQHFLVGLALRLRCLGAKFRPKMLVAQLASRWLDLDRLRRIACLVAICLLGYLQLIVCLIICQLQ